jgi:peptidoglycan-associated lipoprotein
MCKSTITRLVLNLFILTLLASGCAKTPVAEEPSTIEQPTVEIQQQQATEVVEQRVIDTAPAHDAESAAKAAELAASSGLKVIYFDFDQYVLTDAAKEILAGNADLLRSAPAVNVLIEGHSDERGSDEYNMALSEKRALATENYLESLGVAAERMSVISYGEEMPVDSAQTEGAWAKNRRANFKVKL